MGNCRNYRENTNVELDKDGFGENALRNTAHVFSSDALHDFLAKNRFSHVVRAHQVQMEGFQVHFYTYNNFMFDFSVNYFVI